MNNLLGVWATVITCGLLSPSFTATEEKYALTGQNRHQKAIVSSAAIRYRYVWGTDSQSKYAFFSYVTEYSCGPYFECDDMRKEAYSKFREGVRSDYQATLRNTYDKSFDTYEQAEKDRREQMKQYGGNILRYTVREVSL
jgi:hypothetical protein